MQMMMGSVAHASKHTHTNANTHPHTEMHTHSDHVLLHQQQGRVAVSSVTDRSQTAMGVLQRQRGTLAVCLTVVELKGILGTIAERESETDRHPLLSRHVWYIT